MEINFTKFEIGNNKYELTGVHNTGYNNWTYDVVNRTNGNRKLMSEDALIKMLTKFKYEIL